VTTCKNREQHLKVTLPQNLADNPQALFVVLNYGSERDLIEYLESEQRGPIETGRLVLYSHFENPVFRMAHAKNMAHRLAIGEGADILVNLDADNFAGPGFAGYVERQFTRYGPGMFMSARMVPKKMVRGINGRIAVSAKDFLKSGGYDEVKFNGGWSSEDKDYNWRLRLLGYRDVVISPFYLTAVPHNDRIRFQQYPHMRPIAGDLPINPNTVTRIANNGAIGCGAVFRNFDFATPIEIAPIPTRIFGIGLHKTATSSLHAALEILGYESFHWNPPEHARAIWREINYPPWYSPTLERYYALSDLPIPLLYPKLDRAYPGSKFILTIRDEGKWLTSVEQHFAKQRPTEDTFTNIIHERLYGQRTFDRDVFLSRYRRHNAEVSEYFRDRPNDLLVMDMDGGAGWDELCVFLANPVPAGPYPAVNGSEEN
jgi:hypothetical protein